MKSSKVIYRGKYHNHYNGFEIREDSKTFYGIYHYNCLITSATTKAGAFSKYKLMMKMYDLGFNDAEDLYQD